MNNQLFSEVFQIVHSDGASYIRKPRNSYRSAKKQCKSTGAVSGFAVELYSGGRHLGVVARND